MQKDRTFCLPYSFLNPDNLAKVYEDSRLYTNLLTEPFPEFQRIARNRPHKGIDPAYPKTTDGTTASIVQKTGKRVVQQLPTGQVRSDDEDDWLPIVAQFIYTNKIIPYANEDYGLFEKSQLIIENGLTFGFGASYAPFLNHDGYFCPDMTLPYWGDIFLQRGKRSGYSCSYVFYRVWWQKSDIKALLDSEKKLAAAAKKRGDKYESTWDPVALKSVLDNVTLKDQKAKTPTDNERNTNPEGIELVTAFQKGVGAKFYTFCPNGSDKDGTDPIVVRTKVNKDPRGKIPIDWFYGDIDGNNPLGRGVVELVGGLQNLIDSDMQMYQYNRALMLAPPVIKKGNIGDFKFAPNYVIDASQDPNAAIEVLTIDTSAVENYPALYGLQKSQLLNLVNSPDTSISSDVGNPSFSKTDAGVKSQTAAISVDDNAVRKRFESWFEGWSETAINLYFAERSGKEELQLDEDTAQKLQKLADAGNFDAALLSEDNKILIDYDTATPALKFRVDPSTSKVQDDAEQLSLIQEALQTITPQVSYYMGLDGWKFDLGEAYRTLLNLLHIENIDKIVTKMSDEEATQAKNAPFPIIDPPQIRLTGVVPPGAMAAALQNGGVSVQPNQISNDQSVDLGDIYKDPTTSPGLKAQIQKIAGLQPDVVDTQNQAATNVAQQAASQVESLGTIHQHLGPSPEDAQFLQQLKQLGLSDSAAAQAMDMIKKGASEQQVLKELGIGAPNG